MDKAIPEYTENEFISALEKLINSCGTASDDELLFHFNKIIGHPSRMDLIYHPEPGADTSAEGITKTVKEWRAANGLPGFKE